MTWQYRKIMVARVNIWVYVNYLEKQEKYITSLLLII